MIKIRHDDYDFRLSTQQYIEIHEEFKKRELVETLVFQPTQWGRLATVDQELISYLIKEIKAGTAEIALHGWGHFHYDEMEYDFIVRDLMASKYWCQTYFGGEPKVWYTPWNCMSNNMERAAQFVGMTISNESNDIWRFIREAEVEKFSGETLYFHGWKADEMALFPRMMELVVKENERRNLQTTV